VVRLDSAAALWLARHTAPESFFFALVLLQAAGASSTSRASIGAAHLRVDACEEGKTIVPSGSNPLIGRTAAAAA
jgi:hypothetical protein